MALHNIMFAGGTVGSTLTMVTALKYAQHASFIEPRFLAGWQDDAGTTDYGIDRLGSSARTAVWRSLRYTIGKPFRVNRVSIPLGAAVAANMTLIPTLFLDQESTGTALTTINNTNYAGSERRIVFYPAVHGNNDILLQLRWTGTTILPVVLPIVIEVETKEDATG